MIISVEVYIAPLADGLLGPTGNGPPILNLLEFCSLDCS